MMISDENEDKFYQFLIFLIVYYLIDPDFIALYQKKNFKILTNFTRTRSLVIRYNVSPYQNLKQENHLYLF